MKALILAGGLGTRLRPLTYRWPKPLLPVANRPHLEHIFDLLAAHGVREVVLLTSYMLGAFDAAIRRAAERGLEVEVAVEDQPLGTAGAVRNAAELVAGETFFVVNGDILTDADLGELVGLHRRRDAVATLLLTPVEDPSAFGVVPTDEHGRVLGFIEKPPRDQAPSNLINAGVYVFEPEVLERIPAGEVFSAERELFPGMVQAGMRMFAFHLGSYWLDIGTPASYLRANLDALDGAFRSAGTGVSSCDRVMIADGAEVAPGARLSFVCMSEGSRVADRAWVTRSVLLPGSVVGTGARVDRCVLGEGAVIEDGAEVHGMILASGEGRELVLP